MHFWQVGMMLGGTIRTSKHQIWIEWRKQGWFWTPPMYILSVHRTSLIDDVVTFTQTAIIINETPHKNWQNPRLYRPRVYRTCFLYNSFFRSRNSFLTGVYPFRVGLSVSLIFKLANILSVSLHGPNVKILPNITNTVKS